ncbi:MAG: cupin domain-containing protein [Pseudomonadota bacterium]
MTKDLNGGVSRTGKGEKAWNILGQRYYLMAESAESFAFEANSGPGDHVPVHVHPTQDEFILVQEGELDVKLDGEWSKAGPGDLVKMPRGVPHGYFNKSDKPVKALFWVSPPGKLRALFDNLHDLADVEKVVQLSAEHDVDFLPPEANE